ncbi:MAG: hypothetical protein H6R26_2705, partial [Proteobacteria bacterium]|nr:hypothetical protein [Pseudomonadota bacterium]
MSDKGTILVVDDTPAALKLMKDFLTAEGFKVFTADSGELALRSLPSIQPELILLDIRMPGMDGFETARRLKAQESSRDIPVMFISATTEVDERVEGFALGAVDFVSKPFQRDELLARIRTHLELRRLQTGLEKQALERTAALEKSTRAYRALSLSNRLVAHAKQEGQLLWEACDIVHEACGYRLVWIGLAEQNAEKTVRAVAQAGFEENYLANVRITWADEEHGRGPTGSAIRTKQPSINRDALNNPLFAPWREQALKRGYKSSAAFPLLSEEQCLGALTVYSDQVDAFEEEEVRLLGELSANLAYGIRLLRTQAERRRSEELLRASEEKYRALIESTSDWIWEVDPQTRFVYSSPKVTELLGYRPEEIIGKSCLDLMPPEEAERLRSQVEAAFVAHLPIRNLENLNLHRDGGVVVMETSGVPVFDGEGNFTGYRGIDRDVTDRKKTEEELTNAYSSLAQREARMAALLNSLPLVAWLKDEEGRYIACNQAFMKIAGFDNPEGIIGKTDLDLWPPELAHKYIDDDSKVMRTGTQLYAEERAVDEKGNIVWLETYKTPIIGKDDKVLGTAGSARDITERMRLETELQALNDDLQRRVEEEVAKNREKDHVLIQQSRLAAMGEMIHNIAHQWRQPLTALGIIVRNIKDDYDFGELNGETLHKAVTRSQSLLLQMSATIDGFRDFFRPDLEPSEFDMAQAVEDALFVMEASLKNSQIEL